MRLIDAEQFKHKINNSELYDSEEWVKVLDILADCDSIDAVPVVRCKDCMYCDKRTCYLWGEIGIRVSEDGYCNNGIKGERKTDDNY